MKTGTRKWFKGIIGAFVSGVSSAFLSALGVAGADAIGIKMPDLTLKQLGVISVAGGAVGLAAYLKKSPVVPDDENTTETKNEP